MDVLTLVASAFKPRNAAVSAGWSPLSIGMGGGMTGNGYQSTTRAYMGNEIVSAGINLLATSAAEPHIEGKRYRRNKRETKTMMKSLRAAGLSNRAGSRAIDAFLVRNGYWEEVDDHPLVKILNNPNPYMSRGQFWSLTVVYYYLAGNAYALKARYQGGILDGAVGELWPLRPDRMKPIPGDMAKGEPFIKGYEYSIDGQKKFLPKEDVLHFKTRNPLNPYEGLPPLMSIMPRVSIDTYMRTFLSTFFERGGAGAGASLNVKGKMDQSDKDGLRERFKRMFAGGQFDVLVTAADDVTYTPFTLNRGLRDALPKEIDAVNEARIGMVLGIPGSILGLLIGYESSSYANKRQDWQVFWDITMTPLMSDLDDVLNLSLVPEFGGIDEVCFDLSDIRALQEDEDKMQERARKNFQVGGMALEDFLLATGQNPTPDPKALFYVPGSAFVTPFSQLAEQNTRKQAEQGSPAAVIESAVRMLLPPPSMHPRVEEDPGARAVYEEAMSLRGRNPGMTWEQIASRVNVAERTLRKYRAVFDDDD